MGRIDLGRRWIGDDEPTYFVADISANHDGDLGRAKMLIHLAAESGADAAKFQNFRAPKIVSQQGFQALGTQLSHQAVWKKPVFQVYQEASLAWEWTQVLKAECDAAGIEYSSTPYDFEAVDMLEPYVSFYKIGSGDITWPEMLEKIAGKKKPVFLACGASTLADVERAVNTILAANSHLVLMQCNTNYTASRENYKHVNLNVLKTFRVMFPEVLLGLSDHTSGHAAVLGAVALGARVIEKHLTDDNAREGPDHRFSMMPASWREMVERTRELEYALGSTQKRIAPNERETVIVQRRCLRAARDLKLGTMLTRDMIDVLRPAPEDGIPPYEVSKILGMRVRTHIPAGQHLQWTALEAAGESDAAASGRSGEQA